MNVLVVAAHPDDEVLGCGGTMMRLAREGHEVHAVILGEGLTARCDCFEERNAETIEALREQGRRAADFLGLTGITFHDFPDNRFDTVPLLDLIKVVEEHLDAIAPRVVYTHHAGDLNIDHQMTARAVLTAARPMQGVRELYAFEVPSSTEWAFHQLHPPFQPTTFVNIAGTLGAKIQALDCYKSEMRPFPHPRSPELVRALAHQRGATAGLSAAEAFQLIRAVQ